MRRRREYCSRVYCPHRGKSIGQTACDRSIKMRNTLSPRKRELAYYLFSESLWNEFPEIGLLWDIVERGLNKCAETLEFMLQFFIVEIYRSLITCEAINGITY